MFFKKSFHNRRLFLKFRIRSKLEINKRSKNQLPRSNNLLLHIIKLAEFVTRYPTNLDHLTKIN